MLPFAEIIRRNYTGREFTLLTQFNNLDFEQFLSQIRTNRYNDNFEGYFANLSTIYIYSESGAYIRIPQSEELPNVLESIHRAINGDVTEAKRILGERIFGSATQGIWDMLDAGSLNNLRIGFHFNIHEETADEFLEDAYYIQDMNRSMIERHREILEQDEANIILGENAAERQREEEFVQNLLEEQTNQNHYFYYINWHNYVEPQFIPEQYSRRSNRQIRKNQRPEYLYYHKK